MNNKITDSIKSFAEKLSAVPAFNKTLSKKFIIIAFSVLLTVVAVLSVATVVTEKKEKPENSTTDVTQSESSFVSSVNEIKGNFLLVLTQDGTDKINLISVMSIDTETNELTFSFLSPEKECYVNGQGGTMQQHLDNGGINELLWAVGEYAGIAIERYIWGDEENFVNLMKALGETEVQIKERIDYSHRGLSYIIEEGEQRLTADMMLKYFVYLCENRQTQMASLIELLVLYANDMFGTEQDKVEESLGYVVANFTTNLSVVDCLGYKQAIRKMATSLAETKISVVDELPCAK